MGLASDKCPRRLSAGSSQYGRQQRVGWRTRSATIFRSDRWSKFKVSGHARNRPVFASPAMRAPRPCRESCCEPLDFLSLGRSASGAVLLRATPKTNTRSRNSRANRILLLLSPRPCRHFPFTWVFHARAAAHAQRTRWALCSMRSLTHEVSRRGMTRLCPTGGSGPKSETPTSVRPRQLAPGLAPPPSA